MTTTTPDRPRITRPGTSVAIDPRRLQVLRQVRKLRRRQLSEQVTALGRTDGNGDPVRCGPDVIGKYETGQRRPSEDAFWAICEVLGCEPEELLPGGPPAVLPKFAQQRQARLDYQEDLRNFAISRGLRYKNPDNGRVYYRKELRTAHARYAALQAARKGGDPEAIAAAEAAYEEALALAPRADGGSGGPELLAS